MKRFWKWKFIIPAAIVGFPLFMAAMGWMMAQLWNWLLPPLFGLPSVTTWQALGLFFLSRLFFGGWGGGGAGPQASKMSREEKERIRQRMCEGPNASEGSAT